LAPAITAAITYAISSTMLTQNRSWLRSWSAAAIMTGNAIVASPRVQVKAQWLARGRATAGPASAGGGQSGRPCTRGLRTAAGLASAGLAGMCAVAPASSA
jgi:hypothetical protein